MENVRLNPGLRRSENERCTYLPRDRLGESKPSPYCRGKVTPAKNNSEYVLSFAHPQALCALWAWSHT